jgi:glycosyltransferase involved in cell wall biosynthesis
MAMQLPVVSTSIAGIPELITDRANGRLVPPNDVAALAAAIDELLGDEGQRHRLAKAAVETVHGRFDREVNIEELATLFRGAVAEPRPAAAR